MLLKSIKIVGIVFLLGFSFFYTDKVVTIVRNQDPLMIKILDYEASFNKESIDAFVEDNSIIPGVNACVVDTNSSYSNMKKIGSYSTNMIEYREIKPKLSLDSIFDKYIIKGNKDTFEVALVFRINDVRFINDITSILTSKGIKASFFLDGKLIEDETHEVYNLINQGHEIYNLGYDNAYNKDLLVWTNNIIENISYNESKYCLTLGENQKTLDMCSKNKMYTIKSNLVINRSTGFNSIKSSIEKGSIIVFDVADQTPLELNKTLIFLNSKGFAYNTLSNHLSEKGCK
ncbi:MAG: polysaccharide deacetylase family protein [Bacilli bacterium]|jgi:hypothetical protein